MNKTKEYNTMFVTIKKLVLIFTLSIFCNQLIAQTTNGIFFQAVARDNFSNPAKDRKIFVQSSIIQSTPTGTKVLTEEHQANTDATGVFSISLGNGVRVGGTASGLATIDWSKGPFYLNLKVAITPIGGNSSWDYNKEWVDMGTTSFGAVPFALYSASSAKVDDKLNVSDTTTMLKVYAKAIKVQSLETAVASKLTAADTLTMLAPYAKAAYTIDSSFFKSQLATKLSISDSTKYVTPTQLAAKTFDQTPITTAIATKLNIADSTKYVTPTQLAAKTFDQTPITTAIATKLNIADSTKYITPTQLAAKTFDTTSLSSRINLKASTTDVTNAISSEAATARAAELTLTNNLASNTASITANAAAIVSEAATARAAELLLTNNITSNTASITANSVAIVSEAATARAAELTLTNNVASNTASITANSVAIVSEAVTARAAELTLTNNIASNSTSITAINTILSAATSSNTANTIITRDASGNFSAGSITASNYASTPIGLSYSGSTINWDPTVGANAAITLTQNSTLSFSAIPLVGSYGTLVVTQDGTGGRTITLPTISNVTNKVLGSATNTTVSLSTAADAKDILNFYYDGTNCYWNIGQGYGNAPTASFTLTTTGTGAATLSGTTLNIPSVSSTVNAGSISGTIAVANGGTGASTLTGYVKGTGTTAMTASANIPVADVTGAAPLASPTFTGTVTTSTINTGALSATSVNTPIYASTPQTLTDDATISWNPTLGLNANVTLAGNRTLSFTSTPAAGSYGTLVVTQDATGGRTLTLPSTANKVLGSSSTTTITLSTTANAKDILNFYYDGTNCYWNIGQGYGNAPTASFTLTTTGTGAATLSGTTLNIPSVSSTVNAGSVSGTIAVANGGTGATAITGLVKGNGSGAMTAAVAGTDYLLPTDASITEKGIMQLAGDLRGTATSPTVNTVGGVNSATIATFDTRIISATNSITSNTSSITSLNTSVNAATNSNTANTIVKRDASGNFSAGSITASNYASTPISLTYTGSTINWNPTVGANAAITLTQNSTLSFSATPLVGSYGTVVLTQDGTGGRTITLPTISNVTNKVLGSASNTAVSLSTAANAKDILNFYYDGTDCYWNIGQGYGNAPTASFTLTTTGTGAATLSGTTLNIPTVSSTVNAGSLSGTIAVANGGTGATTITGLVKGNGSGAMTAAVAGTDYLLPTDASITEKGIIQLAGDLRGTAASPTVNTVGGVNSSTITTFDTRITTATNSITSNTASITSLNTIITAATNSNTVSTIVKRDASGNFSAGTITANLTGNATTATTAGNVTGTVAVANGGTGATTLTANNVLLGNGTSAVQAVAPGTTGNVLTSNGTTWTSAAPSEGGSTTYSIGDSYGGGIVFYVTSDGKHGLISETQLISPNANSSSNSDIYYYSEAQNMISDPNNHSTNGKLYTDWRLPTKSEFARLYAQRALFNSNYPNYHVRLNYYVWTSTPGLPPNETSKMTTFYQGIPAESAFNAGKSGVIAIRSF